MTRKTLLTIGAALASAALAVAPTVAADAATYAPRAWLSTCYAAAGPGVTSYYFALDNTGNTASTRFIVTVNDNGTGDDSVGVTVDARTKRYFLVEVGDGHTGTGRVWNGLTNGTYTQASIPGDNCASHRSIQKG